MDIPTIGDWLDAAPWRDRATHLIAVGHQGHLEATTLAEKEAVLRQHAGWQYGAFDFLIATWHGRWTTSAREVTTDDAVAILDKLL